MLVEIDNDIALEMLVERVAFWTSDEKVIDLYSKMYENYIESGCFDNGEFNVMVIVDNDYVNYTRIVYKGEEDFKELLKVYNEQGLGDCSCECNIAGFIESVDNEDEPTMFLVR